MRASLTSVTSKRLWRQILLAAYGWRGHAPPLHGHGTASLYPALQPRSNRRHGRVHGDIVISGIRIRAMPSCTASICARQRWPNGVVQFAWLVFDIPLSALLAPSVPASRPAHCKCQPNCPNSFVPKFLRGIRAGKVASGHGFEPPAARWPDRDQNLTRHKPTPPVQRYGNRKSALAQASEAYWPTQKELISPPAEHPPAAHS